MQPDVAVLDIDIPGKCFLDVTRSIQQKQIAVRAGISIKTVQHHIMHLMDKLAIHDRGDLARFAIREGLVEP